MSFFSWWFFLFVTMFYLRAQSFSTKCAGSYTLLVKVAGTELFSHSDMVCELYSPIHLKEVPPEPKDYLKANIK